MERRGICFGPVLFLSASRDITMALNVNRKELPKVLVYISGCCY